MKKFVTVAKKGKLILDSDTGIITIQGGKKDGQVLDADTCRSIAEGKTRIEIDKIDRQILSDFLNDTDPIRKGENSDIIFEKDYSDFILARDKNSRKQNVSYWSAFIQGLNAQDYRELCENSEYLGEVHSTETTTRPQYSISSEELKAFKNTLSTRKEETREALETAATLQEDEIDAFWSTATKEVKKTILNSRSFEAIVAYLITAGKAEEYQTVSFESEERDGDFGYSTGRREIS